MALERGDVTCSMCTKRSTALKQPKASQTCRPVIPDSYIYIITTSSNSKRASVRGDTYGALALGVLPEGLVHLLSESLLLCLDDKVHN